MKRTLLFFGALMAFAIASHPNQARASQTDYNVCISFWDHHQIGNNDWYNNMYAVVFLGARNCTNDPCHVTPQKRYYDHLHINMKFLPNPLNQNERTSSVVAIDDPTTTTYVYDDCSNGDNCTDPHLITMKGMDDWCVRNCLMGPIGYRSSPPWNDSPYNSPPYNPPWQVFKPFRFADNTAFPQAPFVDYDFLYRFKQNSWSFLSGVMSVEPPEVKVGVTSSSLTCFDTSSMSGACKYFDDLGYQGHTQSSMGGAYLGVIDDGTGIGTHMFLILQTGMDQVGTPCEHYVLQQSIEKFGWFGAYKINWVSDNIPGMPVEAKGYYNWLKTTL